jgi:hypothetical protein
MAQPLLHFGDVGLVESAFVAAVARIECTHTTRHPLQIVRFKRIVPSKESPRAFTLQDLVAAVTDRVLLRRIPVVRDVFPALCHPECPP